VDQEDTDNDSDDEDSDVAEEDGEDDKTVVGEDEDYDLDDLSDNEEGDVEVVDMTQVKVNERVTKTVSLIQVKKTRDDLGIVIARREKYKLFPIFHNEQGDHFQCNETDNAAAVELLNYLTSGKRQLTNASTQHKSAQGMICGVFDLKAKKLHALREKYEIQAFLSREPILFLHITQGFTNHEHALNPVMMRIGFYYAAIRLGKHIKEVTYRLKTNEDGVLYTAIEKVCREKLKRKTPIGYKAYMLYIMDLFNGHLIHQGLTPVMVILDNETQKTTSERKTHNKVKQNTSTKEKYIVESRDEVRKELEQLIKNYAEYERVNVARNKWIAYSIPAAASSKKKNKINPVNPEDDGTPLAKKNKTKGEAEDDGGAS
jgi:hypothetical protein